MPPVSRPVRRGTCRPTSSPMIQISWEVLLSSLSVGGIVVGAYVRLVVKNNVMSVRVKFLEEKYDAIEMWLKEMTQTMNEMQLDLKDKIDR